MKKIKILAIALVFSLAALGGAYAMWKDTLTIVEKVYTGNLDVYWTDLCGSDWGCNYEKYVEQGYDPSVAVKMGSLDSMDPENPNECKNIGCKDRVIEAVYPKHKEAENPNDRLVITLKNGYPGYQEYVAAAITNNGTIPVKFMLSLDDPQGIVYKFNGEVVNEDGWLIVEINTVGANGARIEGYQLDPGEKLHIHVVERVRQNAPQDFEGEFTIVIEAQQWNEYGFELPDEIVYERKCQDRYGPW